MTAIPPRLACSTLDASPDAMLIGTEFPAEISWSAIHEAGDTLVAVAIRDVTERKQLETELLMARDALEAMRKLLKTSLDGSKTAGSCGGTAEYRG
jgi:PAS domain-containing protein